MNKQRRLVFVSLVLAGLAAGAAALAYQALGQRETAPPVSYTLLDGAKATSAQWQGKVMLVNFWATSCTTCMHEMPQIISTYEKYKARGFDTLGVAMSYDPPAFVANYVQTRKLPFGVAIDNTGEIARSFGSVQLTPTTFVINKRGEIVKRYVGEPDFAALHGLVEQLLAEG
ncbi:TlpA disulfide reductase family protein [Pelomonas sp. KK5]|uniref:TlpA family protein disulfide reductase n=1 Tax=Pelomonas sp. KK5 TaxID=1855730 RepID=UPI00097C2785|nr:TlpA disulfide reductase family protein [Pelomonas sp. KK5]